MAAGAVYLLSGRALAGRLDDASAARLGCGASMNLRTGFSSGQSDAAAPPRDAGRVAPAVVALSFAEPGRVAFGFDGLPA